MGAKQYRLTGSINIPPFQEEGEGGDGRGGVPEAWRAKGRRLALDI